MYEILPDLIGGYQVETQNNIIRYMDNFSYHVANLNESNTSQDQEDWEKHKNFMTLYIIQANRIIEKYGADAYNLLAVTPIEQWKIL